MDLTMSMFATQADYWKARAELAETTVRETAAALSCEPDTEDMLAVAKNAERYRWLKSRAREEGRDGGWTGMFMLYPVPAWDDTPYAEQRGQSFNFKGDFDAAIDAAMALHNAKVCVP